jgi:hypothetical protein
MGMKIIQETENFQVRMDQRNQSVDLIESTYSLQGEPIYKVTVMKIFAVNDKREPQILERKLIDRQGKLVCSAVYSEMQQDMRSGVVVPRRVEFKYPKDNLTLKMVLDTVNVNGAIPPGMAQAFQRPRYSGIQQYDLARRMLDSNYRTGDVRPAGTYRGYPK